MIDLQMADLQLPPVDTFTNTLSYCLFHSSELQDFNIYEFFDVIEKSAGCRIHITGCLFRMGLDDDGALALRIQPIPKGE